VSRIAANRDAQLTPAEIVTTALRQFDERTKEPSVRSLAAELRVAPAAIYHHFPSISAVYQGAVELVWSEAITTTLELAPNPLSDDPTDVLVAVALATRRTWLAHFRLARHLAATPGANDFTKTSVPLMAGLFERLGIDGEDAAAAFHAYSSFMIGAVLFAADRKTANEAFPADGSDRSAQRPGTAPSQGATRRYRTAARISIENVMDVSEVDPKRDEQLFAQAIRRVVESYAKPTQAG
jgi:AcrR family transcriptional regulator